MDGRIEIKCKECGTPKPVGATLVLLALLIVLALAGCESPYGGYSSSSSSEPVPILSESDSGTSELGAMSAKSDVRDDWFGHVRGSGDELSVVDFSGIEGEYRDPRDGGPTDTHGFYSYFYLGPLTVGDDGKSATGTLDIRWVPHLGEEVRGGAAEFTCDITVSFNPADDSSLACTVHSQQGNLSSEAKIVRGQGGSVEFVWGGGTMRPDYVKAVGEETVTLDASLVKDVNGLPPSVTSASEDGSSGALGIGRQGNNDVEPVVESVGTSSQDFQARLDAIISDRAADPRMGGTTADMIAAGNDYYERFDVLLNDVYNHLDSLPSVDSNSLRASQDAWEAQLAADIESTKAEYAMGSLLGPAVLGVEMQAQEQRINELIAMIPN